MSRHPATSTQLAEMFPPLPAVKRTAAPTGVLPAAGATFTALFSSLHRELFGKRYRRTLDSAGLQF